MEQASASTPDAVVFGGTGFIGSWTALHLLGQGRTVAAVVRASVQGHADAGTAGEPMVLRWAATRPHLRRLIHLSGYRVGLDQRPRYPLPEAELAKLYQAIGTYEGSKTEADAAVRVVAAQLGVHPIRLNPPRGR